MLTLLMLVLQRRRHELAKQGVDRDSLTLTEPDLDNLQELATARMDIACRPHRIN
jgi:hypothetical protein